MKKILVIILSLIIAASTAACGSAGAAGNNGTAAANVDLSGEISGEITVSCYETMTYKTFLEEAAKLFEEKYPGTKVNIETFSAMPEVRTADSGGGRVAAVMIQDDPQGRSDYVNKVNTAMMSGGGADILAMDVLPYQKYASSGQLENLGSYMDADPEFNRSDYRQNILDAIEYKSGTWFLPLNYSFNYYTNDSTLLQDGSFGTNSSFNTQQLIDLAASAFDGSSKMFDTPNYTRGPVDSGLFGKLFTENYSSYVDLEKKKANFNDGSFAELLNSIQEYADQGYVPEGMTGRMDAGDMIRGGGQQAPTARYFYKSKNNFMLSQFFNKNSGRRIGMYIGGVEAGIEDDDEIAGIAANQNGEVPFTYGQAYSINSNSKNKQTAWAFIKFLLSEEMQLSTYLSVTELPLHNSAREQRAELVFSGAFMGGRVFIGGENAQGPNGQNQQRDDAPVFDEVEQEVVDNYKKAVEELSDQINSFTVRDSIVDDMISTEIQYFFDGEKNAEDVAKTLQSKIELYLNE